MQKYEPILQSISPELFCKVTDKSQSPNALPLEREAAALTIQIAERTQDEMMTLKMRQLAEILKKKSSSKIEQNYSHRLLTAMSDFKDFSKRQKDLAVELENAINTLLGTYLSPETSSLRPRTRRKIRKTLGTYQELMLDISQLHPKSSEFTREFTPVHHRHVLKKQQFDQTLQNLSIIFHNTCLQCEQENSFIPIMNKWVEIKKDLRDTFDLLTKETKIVRRHYMISSAPIQDLQDFLQTIYSYAALPKKARREKVPDVQQKIRLLKQEYSEFNTYFNNLLSLFTSRSTSFDRIISAASELDVHILMKAKKIQKQIGHCLGEAKLAAIETASARIVERTCANSECPHETEQKDKSSVSTLHYGIKKCGGCRKVYYCSPECQKADWPLHKVVCLSIKPT